MFYSGWQALYGTYCVGTNKLSLSRRWLAVFVCITIAPSLVGKFHPKYPPFVTTPPGKISCSDSGIVRLTAKDITPQGLVLDKPNVTYCLTEDVQFTPDKPGRAAITITASGVGLLLDNVTLTQGGSTSDTYGILVDGGTYVTMYGGSISGFTGKGVLIRGANGVVLDTMTSSHNPGSGFWVVGSDQVTLMLCTATHNGESGVTVRGLTANGAPAQIFMEHCVVKNNTGNQDIDFS